MEAYRLLFCRLCEWAFKVNGPHSEPEHTANATLTALALLNILSITTLVELVLRRTFYEKTPTIEALVLFAVVATIHYLIFVREPVTERATEEPIEASESDRKRGNALVWTYIVGTIAVAFLLAIIRRNTLL